MEQSVITFRADEQELVKTGGVDKYASSTVSYVEAQFTLGENWNGFDSVRAMWRFGSDVMATVLDHEGKCQVPHELLEKRGKLLVNLVGSIVEDEVISDRLTTYPIVALIITKVAMVDSDETEVSPSQFEQFVAIVHQDALDAEDSALESEAWAVGEKNGEAVGSGDPQYHNNAKYWSDTAHSEATDAETAKVASQTAQGKAEDAQGKAETAQEKAETAQGKAEDAQHAIEDLSVTASVGTNTGTPSVVVTKSTVSGHENLDFDFDGLKGETGANGDKGDTGYPTDAQVTTAVDAWLDAHPEATTTVQDNSVTDAKLVQSGGVLSEVEELKSIIGFGSVDIDYGFELRNIQSSNGEYQTSNTRIASDHFAVTKGTKLSFSDNTAQYYIWFYDTNDNYINFPVGAWRRGEYTFDKAYNVVVTIRKDENNTVISSGEVATLASYLSVSYKSINASLEETSYIANSTYNALVGDIYYNDSSMWGRYVIGSAHGEGEIGTTGKIYQSSTTRISLRPIISTDGATHLTLSPTTGYKYYLFTFDKELTKVVVDGGWETTEKTYTLVNTESAYFTVCMAKTDNSEILPTDCINVSVSVKSVEARLKSIEDRLDSLPSYWESYLLSKEQELESADLALGFDGVSFAFVTDVHINTNNKVSPEVLKYIAKHTNVRSSVCGGDIVTDYNTKTNALKELYWWMQNTSDLDIVNLHGNHDGNSNNQTDITQIISDAEFYSLCCRQSESSVNWVQNKLYGYSDNAVQKMRFIYLDTSAPDSAVIDSTQIDWMKSRISELQEGWFVIVFCHQFWTGASKTTPTLNIDANGTAILNALESIYDTVDATICCVVTGHCHRDYNLVSSKGFPVIATTCDASGTNSSLYDPDTPNRTQGTTGEQVIDLYYVNTLSRTINTIRIGDGDTTQNRSFTF